jgi:hypothetical protein
MTPPKASRRSKRLKPKPRKSCKPNQPPSLPALLERNFSDRRSIQIPQVKGKTVEKVVLDTASEFHCITIDFQDRTALTLIIEPCFLLQPSLRLVTRGEEEIVKEWPPLLSATEL